MKKPEPPKPRWVYENFASPKWHKLRSRICEIKPNSHVVEWTYGEIRYYGFVMMLLGVILGDVLLNK